MSHVQNLFEPVLICLSLHKFKVNEIITQPAITCSKLTIETLEQVMKICSKLKIRIPERWRRSGTFIVNFEHI